MDSDCLVFYVAVAELQASELTLDEVINKENSSNYSSVSFQNDI